MAVDLVGTVRKEHHDGGYSLWVLVEHAFSGPTWLCTESTARGNKGQELAGDMMWGKNTPVIGAVPGSKADAKAAKHPVITVEIPGMYICRWNWDRGEWDHL